MRQRTERINLRNVRALRAGTRDTFMWDGEVKGFGVRCRPSGARLYVLKYRVKGSRRQRWITIGRHGSPWTPERARTEAKRLLGEVADRRDPAATRDADRAAMTVSQLCGLYMREAPKRILRKTGAPKKSSTLLTDRGRIERHIKPLLGRLMVPSVTRDDVERFLRDVTDGKTVADVKTKPRGRAIVEGGAGTARRTVGLLGGIFSFAVERKMRADNPVLGVERGKDRASKRHLSGDELVRLGQTLAQAKRESPFALAGIRLLLLTGARKGEILTAKWSYVDWENGLLNLPDSKTGQKSIILPPAALEVLKSLPRIADNPYILAGENKGAHLVGLPKAWERIRAKAGLSDVRLHDLRHSFGAFAVSGGATLPILGALLGHRDWRTTQRYAHLQKGPMQAAAERVSSAIAAALGASADATVVAMKRRKAR